MTTPVTAAGAGSWAAGAGGPGKRTVLALRCVVSVPEAARAGSVAATSSSAPGMIVRIAERSPLVIRVGSTARSESSCSVFTLGLQRILDRQGIVVNCDGEASLV